MLGMTYIRQYVYFVGNGFGRVTVTGIQVFLGMGAFLLRLMNRIDVVFLSVSVAFSFAAFAQPTHAITDPEKKFKDAKELFVKEQFALAYPLFAELKAENPDNTVSNHTYINDDVNYYYIVCELKLQQPVAEQEARHYISVVPNEPRRQLLSYHLAKYYFISAFIIILIVGLVGAPICFGVRF